MSKEEVARLYHADPAQPYALYIPAKLLADVRFYGWTLNRLEFGFSEKDGGLNGVGFEPDISLEEARQELTKRFGEPIRKYSCASDGPCLEGEFYLDAKNGDAINLESRMRDRYNSYISVVYMPFSECRGCRGYIPR
jgi:hypothetical protein